MRNTLSCSSRKRVLGVVTTLFSCIFATGNYAEAAPPSSTTRASFELVVEKSTVLRPGKTRLDAKSAFATLTNKFGGTTALRIQFFTRPIDKDAQAKLEKDADDNREMSKDGHATFL